MSGHTSLLLLNGYLDIRFLERAPFEVFLVAAAFDMSLRALLTSGLLFAALETFRFARQAACE